jgi:mono/diheme cytochrome c family protein
MMKSMQWSGVIASLVSLIALSGCSGDPVEEERPKATELMGTAAYTVLSATDAPAGATQPPASYGTICLACHRENAQGFTGIGPEIRHTPSDYAMYVVRNGLKTDDGMPTAMIPYPATSPDPKASVVSDADLAAIIQWSNALPRPTTPAGLYMDFCGNCHGPVNPTGGQVPINIQGLPAATVDAAVRGGYNPTLIGNRDEYMPKFDEVLLPPGDLAMIKTYIGTK